MATSALFLSTGGLLEMLLQQPAALDGHGKVMASGSVVTQIVWASMYSLFIGLAFVRRDRLLETLLKERAICLLLGLAILSILWSDAPSATTWNCGRLTASTLFGIYLAKNYKLEDIFYMVAWVTAVAAVLSAFVALALPQYGLDEYLGKSVWRGVFTNKNMLGANMALGAVTWLIFALGAGRPRWLGILLFTVCSLLVLLSTSDTSLVVECVLLVVIVAFTKVHRSVLIFGVISVIAVLVLGGLVAAHPVDLLFHLLNRDETLTGRSQIWSEVWVAICKHPWLGYGYMAFWRGINGPSADASVAGWIPGSAHNGYLDLGLQFGILGPVLFAIALAKPVFHSIRCAQRRSNSVELFPLIFLLFIALSNLTESSNLTPNTMVWDLFVAISVQQEITRSEFKRSRRGREIADRLGAWNSGTAAAIGISSNGGLSRRALGDSIRS